MMQIKIQFFLIMFWSIISTFLKIMKRDLHVYVYNVKNDNVTGFELSCNFAQIRKIYMAVTAQADHSVFCSMDSTIPLHSKYAISSLQPSSVAVQPSLCQMNFKHMTRFIISGNIKSVPKIVLSRTSILITLNS